jgi:hypothetical protein
MSAHNEKITLQFLSNESEEDEGLGHAGIETYRSKPYAGAARETGQNSLDAADTTPVRLSFDVLEVPAGEVPALEDLRVTVQRCLREAKGDNREKEQLFFAYAKTLLDAGSIKVLRVSDHNTKGARGPAATKGTPFYSLTRANGVSAKDREDSGGSYGIGKNAAFAVSDLRTVFYSTVYLDDKTKTEKFLALGKSVLVSHHDDQGKPYRQIGYWGLPGFRAVESAEILPSWFRRVERGTSVFVVGFREEPDWQHRIASALIANFFPAIHEGQMEFTVGDGKIVIGRETLQPLFADQQMIAAAEANGHRPQFEVAQDHYRCLISPEAKDHDVQIPSLGMVRIRVLVGEGLSKKICITRNGLVITDSLKNFGQPFSRFPMCQDFVAVVSPLETAGSAFIKKLEDPKHEELSPEGLPDEAARAHAKAVIKRLGYAIRDAIKADSIVQYASEVAANEMRQYFASESEPRPENRTSPNDDPEVLRYRIEPHRPRQRPSAITEGGGSVGPEVAPAPGPGPGPHPGPGPGPGPNPGPGPMPTPTPVPGPDAERAFRAVRLSQVRTVVPTGQQSATRSIYFTTEADGTLQFSLEAVGVNDNETLKIVGATGANVVNGSVRLDVHAGQRHKVDVVFSEAYDGPVEMRARLASPATSTAAP